LLTKLEFIHNSVLHNDSQSAIHLTKNLTFHFRTKYIDLWYYFIKSLLEDMMLILRF